MIRTPIYKNLNEFSIKQWDGNPFTIDYLWNDTEAENGAIQQPKGKYSVVGYVNGYWNVVVNGALDSDKEYFTYKHVALHSGNNARMTNAELSYWLSFQRGGQKRTKSGYITTLHSYPSDEENEWVDTVIKVRPYGTTSWITPTISLLKA